MDYPGAMPDDRTSRDQDPSSYDTEFRGRDHVSRDRSSRYHSRGTQLTDSLSRGVDASGSRQYVRAHDDPQYRTNTEQARYIESAASIGLTTKTGSSRFDYEEVRHQRRLRDITRPHTISRDLKVGHIIRSHAVEECIDRSAMQDAENGIAQLDLVPSAGMNGWNIDKYRMGMVLARKADGVQVLQFYTHNDRGLANKPECNHKLYTRSSNRGPHRPLHVDTDRHGDFRIKGNTTAKLDDFLTLNFLKQWKILGKITRDSVSWAQELILPHVLALAGIADGPLLAQVVGNMRTPHPEVEDGKLADNESQTTQGIIATNQVGRASSLLRPDAEEVQSNASGRSPLSVIINDNHGSITLSQMSTPVEDQGYKANATNGAGLVPTEQPTTLARKPTLMDNVALSDHISSRPEEIGSSKRKVDDTDGMLHAPYHSRYDGRARRGPHRGNGRGDLDLPADGMNFDENAVELSYD